MTVTRTVPADPFTEKTKYTKAATCEMAKERLYIKLDRVEKALQSSTLQEQQGRCPQMPSWLAEPLIWELSPLQVWLTQQAWPSKSGQSCVVDARLWKWTAVLWSQRWLVDWQGSVRL